MIQELLSAGAENALPGRYLCGLLEITLRDLTQAIERERREGAPICASTQPPYGYFLASNRAEMEGYCRSLTHRIGEINQTRRACLATLDRLPE